MSYYFADVHGYMNDAASREGWDAFAKWAESTNIPLLNLFLQEGVCYSPHKLAQDLAKISSTSLEVDLILDRLRESAFKADELLSVIEANGV